MKRIATVLLVCALAAALFAGCTTPTASPDGATAVKLLLAAERLNEQLLQTEGDIFENGVETMNRLAGLAVANLGVRSAKGSAKNVAASGVSTVLEGDYIGKVEIDGSTFRWSDLE